MTNSSSYRFGLTQKELFDALHYEPSTGKFFWKISPVNGVCVGDEAGSIISEGYRVIGYRKSVYMAHRLAWLFMTGEWPKLQIDHKNNIRSDNSWSNLRLATNTQNQQNRRTGRGSSRYIGVSYNPGTNKDAVWAARIMLNRKPKWIGRFKCETAAYVAYCAEKAKLHTFAMES